MEITIKANKPMVSIVIPVYNGSNYLCEAIDSALSQTYENTEVIVVDDGSTDNTKEICKLYGNKIRYFFKNNGGVSTALNFGIKKMNGEYFSWLSHDDKYSNKKIENQMKLIGKSKNEIIFCNHYRINSLGKIIGRVSFNHLISKIDKKQISFFMIFSNLLTGCSLLINKSLFKKYGFFNTKYRYTQDYRKWLQFLDEEFIFDNNYDVYIRYHEEQDTVNYLWQSGEMDLLWSHAIEILNKRNYWNFFLGEKTSLFFFFLRFKNFQEYMPKTLEIVKNYSVLEKDKKVSKNILKYFPELSIYLGKPCFFKYILWYYRQNGLKLFCNKVIEKISKILR